MYALADARIGSGWSERPGKQPESLYFSRRYSARHLFSCSRTRFRTLNFPENGADCASAPPPALPGAFTGLPGTRPKRAAAAKHGDHLEKKQKRALFQSAAAHPGGSAPRIPTYSTTQEDDSRAFQPGSTAEKGLLPAPCRSTAASESQKAAYPMAPAAQGLHVLRPHGEFQRTARPRRTAHGLFSPVRQQKCDLY